MNKTIIIILIIFILLCFLLYKLTFKNRTESKIRQFERTRVEIWIEDKKTTVHPSKI